MSFYDAQKRLSKSSCRDDAEVTSPAKTAPPRRGFCDFGWDDSRSSGDSEEEEAAKAAGTEQDSRMQLCPEEDEDDPAEEIRELEWEDGSQRPPQQGAEHEVQRTTSKDVRRVGGGLYPARSSLHPRERRSKGADLPAEKKKRKKY